MSSSSTAPSRNANSWEKTMFLKPWPGDDAPREEQQAWVGYECEAILYELELEAWGVLHRYAGLVGKVPLCNDGPDY